MSLAVKVNTDETVEHVELGPDILAGMYRHIGCDTVDCVALADGVDMWVDDEGAFRTPDAINRAATELAAMFRGRATQPYWGPVLITGSNPHGETLEMTMPELVTRMALAMSESGR